MVQGRHKEAFEQFERVTKLNDSINASLAHANIANLLSRRELPETYNLSLAEQHLRFALQIATSPQERMGMRYNLSHILHEQGKREEALEILDELEKDLLSAMDLKMAKLLPYIRIRKASYRSK
ncbi:MAG: hypothetical protein HC883_03160 [Bdellovibrionaceae bacterium]|nr:hypothetical protein [Pseudobdellovibrionaceae bacterium]